MEKQIFNKYTALSITRMAGPYQKSVQQSTLSENSLIRQQREIKRVTQRVQISWRKAVG